MIRNCWLLLLCILHLQYDITAAQTPTFSPFTLAPTLPTSSPTHRPTTLPTKQPTLSPTIALSSDQDIKIVVDVTLSGEAISDLCSEDQLDKYEHSLDNVFIAASGVSQDDVKKAVITDCNILDDNEVKLTYNMRSGNSRARNTVIQRIDNGEFLSTYQDNLNLVFTDVWAMSAELIEADAATKEKSDDDPFHDFFSAYFGLGVIIFVVASVWCFLLRSTEDDIDQLRLKKLREDKTKFEKENGVIEEDSVEGVERDGPGAVELVDNTKPSTTTETVTKEEPAQSQNQTHTQQEAYATTSPEPAETKTAETKTEGPYRASVVNEVKHVTKQEERASLDLDQIKDPGNKRRKTQEYLNNLWDDKNEKENQGPKEEQEEEEEDGSDGSEE